MTAARKPKHVSKTKQELRRLRAFAAMFLHDAREGQIRFDVATLRMLATAALTGKKPEAA